MQRWIFEHHLLQQKLRSPPDYTAWTVASIWEGNKVSAVFILGKEDWSFQHNLKVVHLKDWCEPVVLRGKRPDHMHQKHLLLLLLLLPQSPVLLLTI